jgi:hypothetical protein
LKATPISARPDLPNHISTLYRGRWMFEACRPSGPCVTLNLILWPSLRVFKPFILIAEKCANKSPLPLSGMIKPIPTSSLNHLTVLIAIQPLPTLKHLKSSRKLCCIHPVLPSQPCRICFTPHLAHQGYTTGQAASITESFSWNRHAGKMPRFFRGIALPAVIEIISNEFLKLGIGA